MPLELPKFTIWLNPLDDGPEAEHSVTINHQDQLRAELELTRAGMPVKAALNMTNAWCWAAMVRTGRYSGPWERFREIDCAGIEGDEGETETVDPTPSETPREGP